MNELRLKSAEFRRGREDAWRHLEEIVARAERSGVRELPGPDLVQLPRLYRSLLSSLSVARSISLDRALLEYLEALAARAWFQVYGVRRRALDAARDFLARGFPRAVRAAARPLALAAAVLLLGTTVGLVLVSRSPDRFWSFVDEGMAAGRDPTASTESLRRGLYDEGEDDAEGLGTFSSYLFQHNARVGVLCFALGFALGVPTLLLLFTNGLLLGAFTALFASRGLTLDFVGWVLPHGVTELLAIVLCGAAGLSVGTGVAFPGRLSRTHALLLRGRSAAGVVLGTVLMFFVAGLLEGFFRQLVTDRDVRLAVALLSAGFWTWYFTGVGRAGEQRA